MPFDAYSALAALAEAGIGPAEQVDIMRRLYRRLDKAEAKARRNRAIMDAVDMVGSVPAIANALDEYRARSWPYVRHLSRPPEAYTPLNRCYFEVCLASCDHACDINAATPCDRTIQRVVYGQAPLVLSEMDA